MPVVNLDLDSRDAVRGLDKYDDAVDQSAIKTDTAFGKMRASVNNFGKIVGLAMLAAGAAVTAFAVKSIGFASTMEETQNKYNVVFEGMTETTNKWVEELRANYAVSEQAAKEYLASTKAIIDGTGLETESAAKLSNQLVLLAQDLASFHDKAPEQAVRAMTSALTGEYEAMKQFGVVIKKTEVIQQAMIENNLKNKNAVTQAMEAQAAYTLILQRSGKAQGDTIRSQESYAFQLKQTKALLNDLITGIGTKLLPLATKLLTTLNEWAIEQDGVNKVINFTIEAIRFVDNGIRGLVLIAKGVTVAIATAFDFATNAITMLLKPLDLVLDGLVKLGLIDTNPLEKLTEFSENFLKAQIEGFNATYDGIIKANEMYDGLKETVKETTDETKKHTEAVAETVAAVSDFSQKSDAVFKKVNGQWVQVGGSAQKVADVVEKEVIPAEEDLKTTVDAVTVAANQSVQAINQQAIAAEKIVAVAKKMTSLSDEMGGFDTHKRTSTGTFDAAGGLSDEEWQSLPQWAKDDLVKQGTQGSSYFYHTKGAGEFKGVTPAQRQESQSLVANMYFNFTQSMSRSDVESIVEDATRIGERA